jgi:predicted GNAT superfamily acetyltransferase
MRGLPSLEDADAILRVMIATWGDHQLIPREMLRALGESGNVPYGAFDGDELIGFVLGWVGVDDGGLHVHSHMLAALPDRRHRGIGYALKLAQRAQALDQGVRVVRWTFDPMVARNAHLNLTKLGCIAVSFHRNFYGVMPDSLNAGERSDRLLVRWDLDREPGPGKPAGEATIVVPADYEALRSRDRAGANAARDNVADALEAAFGRGLIVAGFDRERGAYLLGTRADRS